MKVCKSARWENGQQKLQWELATARNALKFKKQVEGGLCVPEEVTCWSHCWSDMVNILKVRKKLEEKTQLSKEEEEVLRQAAELAKRRKKLHWLKTEQQMVDLHLAIRFWSSHNFLSSQRILSPVLQNQFELQQPPHPALHLPSDSSHRSSNAGYSDTKLEQIQST